MHQGRSYWQRLATAWDAFYHFRPFTGPLVTVLTSLLVISASFLRRTRIVALGLVVPFLFLYGLFFSYEIRNGLLAFPLVALVCGETFHHLLALLRAPLPRRLARFAIRPHSKVSWVTIPVALISGWLVAGAPGYDKIPALAAFLSNPWIFDAMHLFMPPVFFSAVLALSLALVVRVDSGAIEVGRLAALGLVIFVIRGVAMNSREALIASQEHEARATIGSPAANERLYAMIEQKHIKAGIVTDYWFLRALPGIDRLFRPTDCSAPCTISGLRASLRAYPDAEFALMQEGNLAPETREQVQRGGEFNNLFLVDGVRFLHFRRGLDGGPLDPSPPSLASVVPASGRGAGQEFRLIFSDPNGADDISDIILIINSRLQGAGACYIQWNRSFNSITLANDNGVGWAAEKLVGKPGDARNSQCTVDSSRMVVTERRTEIELRIPIHFAPSFAGVRHFYGTAVQQWTGTTAAYKDAANWVVP
jgi:hypothetical protein